jgi:excisionase family DNA binding protein
MGTTTETTARYLPYPAAASYSGMSVQTLRRLVESGRLKAYRPAGARKVVFDKVELDVYIHASARTPASADPA